MTELVTMAEIARRLEVSRARVSVWFKRRDDYRFPAVKEMRGSRRLFDWTEVRVWRDEYEGLPSGPKRS